MPRITDVELEARLPFAQRSHGRIEDMSVGSDFPLRAECRELFPVDGLNDALFITEKDESTRNETGAATGLERFERSEKPVNRASRCARRRLIDRDCEEATVLPVFADG